MLAQELFQIRIADNARYDYCIKEEVPGLIAFRQYCDMTVTLLKTRFGTSHKHTFSFIRSVLLVNEKQISLSSYL